MNASIDNTSVATVSRYSLLDLFIATTLIAIGVAWLNFLLERSQETAQETSSLILAGGVIGAGGFYLVKRLQSGMMLGMIATAALAHFGNTVIKPAHYIYLTELISIKTIAAMLLGSIAAFAIDYWRVQRTCRVSASRELLELAELALLLVLVGSFGLQVLNATFYDDHNWPGSRHWELSTVPVQFLFHACGACIGAGFLALSRKKLWGAILGVLVVILCIADGKLPPPRTESNTPAMGSSLAS